MINYNNKIFCSIKSTANGDVDSKTVFNYHQTGNIVSATYSGGKIVSGHLIAIADDVGNLICIIITLI